MPTFEPEDFLAALKRLYDSQVKFDEELKQLKERQAQTDGQLDRTSDQLSRLASYIHETAEIVRLTNEQMQHTDARLDQLVGLVRSHEERLQRIDSPPS